MKTKILEKLKNINFSKKAKIALILFIILGVSLAAPAGAVWQWVTDMFAGILSAIIFMLGWILILVVNTLISIASWDLFIHASAVSFGWTVVRDLCNMFFIVIMLAIAFGTILNLEQFNYKKLLPKLILMAILINFSKLICGLFIDVAQVIMLTFVNSFASFGAGAMLDNLGVQDTLQLSRNSEDVGFWTVLAAYLLGIIYILIAIVVCVAMLAMLGIRIVMIWIYVVLSPLAYLLSAFPPGQKFASQWWSEFSKNLIVGPVLAFFLWLSLVSLQADNMKTQINDKNEESKGRTTSDQGFMGDVSTGDKTRTALQTEAVTKASSPGALIKFVIAIGMLIGGLQISSQIGGAAGKMAGSGMKSVNKLGQIGKNSLARASGASYVSGVYKNYQSGRKSQREAKYKRDAETFTEVAGEVRRNINPLYHLGNRYAKKEKNIEEEMKKKKVKMEAISENFNRKRGKLDFSTATDGFEYNKKRDEFVNKETGVVMSTSGMIAKVKEDKNENIYQYDPAKKKWTNAIGDEVENKDMKQKIKEKEESYDKEYKKDERGLHAAKGSHKFLKSFASNMDLETAKNNRYLKVQEKEKEYKDATDLQVTAALSDPSISAFSRAAASLEAYRRGLLSRDRALSVKKKLLEGEGLGGSRNGVLNDKKLGGYIESVISKGQITASNLFEDARSTDSSVRDIAHSNIQRKMQSGEIKMESLDEDTLEEFMPNFVAALRPKELIEAIKGIKEGTKKDVAIEAMQNEIKNIKSSPGTGTEKINKDIDAHKMMTALFQVLDLDKATANAADPDAAKKAIIAEIPFNELVRLFNEEKEDKYNPLIEAVDKLHLTVKDFKAAEKSLRGSSVAAEDLRGAEKLNLPLT